MFWYPKARPPWQESRSRIAVIFLLGLSVAIPVPGKRLHARSTVVEAKSPWAFPSSRTTPRFADGKSGPRTDAAAHYRMRLSTDDDRVQMEACFPGDGLDGLVPGEPFGRPFVRQSRGAPHGRFVAWRHSPAGIAFPPQQSPFCVAYEVDLASALRSAGSRVAERVGAARSVDPDLLLLRPARWGRGNPAGIEVCLPRAWSLSVPWAPRKKDSRDGDCAADPEKSLRYQLSASVFARRGRLFWGAFPLRSLRVPGLDLEVALLDGAAMQANGVEDWLLASVGAVSRIYGVFPRERVQVSVRHASGRGALFGQVFRAGGVGTHFWVGESTTPRDFRFDWVAVHELAHLALPFVRTSEPWLSEGIATYYQNLLRARAGWISEEEMWRDLIGGIRTATGGERTSLRQAASEMMQTGAFRRVYWEGAALVWWADVTLRVRSEGTQSLDRALHSLKACCLPSEQRWTARRLYRKLDELTHEQAFADVFEAHLDRAVPPPWEEMLERLGISVEQSGRVRLRNDAPWAHIRRAMAAPPGSAQRTSFPNRTN